MTETKTELSEGEKLLDALSRGGYQIRGVTIFTSRGELIGLTAREERSDMPGRFYVQGLYSRDNVEDVEELRNYCISSRIEFSQDLRSDEKERIITRLMRRR